MLIELKKALLTARKDKDELKTSALTYLLSKIQNKEIELRAQKEELTNEHIEKVIRKQVKDLGKAIDMFEKGARQDLVDQNTEEKELLEEILREHFE